VKSAYSSYLDSMAGRAGALDIEPDTLEELIFG
jgi:hypothetical protein